MFLYILFHLAAAILAVEHLQHPLLDATSATSPKNNTISKELYDDLEELSRLVDISYCVGVQGPGISKPFQCLKRCDEFPNLELVDQWSTGQLLSDSCGYVALSHPPSKPRIILAFRGTYSLANTIADLSTIPQEYVPYPTEGGDDNSKCNNCTIHSGFWTSWKNTRDVIMPHIKMAHKLYPDYQLTLVGHSLGGAVSTLAALELLSQNYSPILTTFGAPRLGNQNFVDYIDRRFDLSTNESLRIRRVTHADDPVPFLPLEEWGYKQHSGEIFISKSDLPPELEDIQYCHGQADPICSSRKEEDSHLPWHIPLRYRIWQLLFAHRDYFWRIGLCLPDFSFPWFTGDHE